MKFLLSSTAAIALSHCFFAATMVADVANADLIKMCLFYKVAGHARTDPIISQDCVSDHVHTFYGPQLFHPRTTNEDLRNSDSKFSTSVFEENKSLYWHPTIYKVGMDPATGEPTYELAEVSFAGPYYRWDRDAPPPKVEAFPKDFQMIAGNDPTLEGLNLFSECLCPRSCERTDGLCESKSTFFPSDACGEMGISMTFPTCWDDSKGLGNNTDHSSHMAYTLDGTVTGACPEGYNRRLPQLQLFVRLANYEGGQYTFSDNTLQSDKEVFHADFMNGWDQDVLEDIVDNCNPLPGEDPEDYNPECACDQFLTKKSTLFVSDAEEGRDDAEAAKVCPTDVRNHIVDEKINFGVGGLPRGSCSAPLIEGVAPTYVEDCGLEYTPNTFDEDDCDGSSNESEEEDDCVDDKSFRFRGDDQISCRWIGKTEKRVDKYCPKKSKGENVSDACPVACDACSDNEEEEEEDDCVDKKLFRFRGDDQKSCKWIAKKDKRINKYCPLKSEGKKVFKVCPVACDAC